MKHLTPFVSTAALLSSARDNLGAAEPRFGDPNVCHQYDEEDYEDVEGSVMGGGMEVVGYTDSGRPLVVTGARRAGTRGINVRKPGWRRSQLAPGVIAPDEGMLPLPLNSTAGNNTFTAALPTLTFQGQLQKPFRGERLLVSTVRTGTSAVGRLISQLFVGTDLQQLDIFGFDAEQVGTPNAFGVRLTMKPAQPGVFIRLVTTLSTVLAGTDTIFATVTLLGRLVH